MDRTVNSGLLSCGLWVLFFLMVLGVNFASSAAATDSAPSPRAVIKSSGNSDTETSLRLRSLVNKMETAVTQVEDLLERIFECMKDTEGEEEPEKRAYDTLGIAGRFGKRLDALGMAGRFG